MNPISSVEILELTLSFVEFSCLVWKDLSVSKKESFLLGAELLEVGYLRKQFGAPLLSYDQLSLECPLHSNHILYFIYIVVIPLCTFILHFMICCSYYVRSWGLI